MTAMLVPPVRPVRDLGWKQVLGFAQGRDGFWADVRGYQLSQLGGNLPFNVTLLGVNLAAVLASFGQAVAFSRLLPWLIGIVGLASLWTVRSLRAGRRDAAGLAGYWRVTAEIAVLAMMWAGLTATLMPALTASQQAVVMLESLIFLACACNSAMMMPVAVLLVAAIISAGMMVAVPAAAPLDHPLVWMGLASVAVMKLRSAYVITHGAMARLKTEAELNDQGEVVRLLLNEYEANGSDWLLELDALGRMVPEGAWRHDRVDNTAAAHIKATILGPSETVPVRDGSLQQHMYKGTTRTSCNLAVVLNVGQCSISAIHSFLVLQHRS
jgi:hypothetical protein